MAIEIDKTDWLGVFANDGDEDFPDGEGWYIVDENDVIQAGPYRYDEDGWEEVNSESFERKVLTSETQ